MLAQIANSGFWVDGEYPDFETALYGAAGIAHNAAIDQAITGIRRRPQ
jgi:hypothetical protein